MRFKLRDGKNLNYQILGDGQPIVLIHGFGGYQQIWTDQLAPLVASGYQVITYDQRDHGASSRDEELAEITTLIDDLAELLIGIGLTNPILVGHSMGASVIYGLLQRHPEIALRAVVGVDQSPKMLNTPQWTYGYIDATRANYQLVLKNHGNRRETLKGIDQKVFEQLAIVKQQFPFVRLEHLPLLYHHAKQDWRQAVITTTVPMLLITANQSPYFNGEFADVLQAKNDLITHLAIDQSGHCPMAEQPQAFNQGLLEYLHMI